MGTAQRMVLLTRLRNHILMHVAYVRRCTYATGIEVSAVDRDGFCVVFQWKDGRRLCVRLSSDVVFEHGEQMRDLCWYRRRIIDDALQFRLSKTHQEDG